MTDEHRHARERLDLRPGRAVLDVACGPGNFTRAFGRAVGPDGLAVGLDTSPTMLARALADTGPDHQSVTYVRADATALPFRDGSFDAVCCFAALHFFSDPFAALGGVHRVLKPGGRVALLTTVRRGPGIVGDVVGATSGMRMWHRGELEAGLEGLGYADVTASFMGAAQLVAASRA